MYVFQKNTTRDEGRFIWFNNCLYLYTSGHMLGSGPPFRRAAILKGLPFWKPSFMVVAWNSSWYCHKQTTDANPNRIPNHKLLLLEMAENGGPFGMAAPRNGGLTPHVNAAGEV